MFFRDRAIFLKITPYRETGYIIKAFLERRGLGSFIIQGVRGKVKRRRYFEVFSCYDMVFYDTNKSDLKRIKECSPIAISSDYSPMRDFMAGFTSDIFLQCIKEEEHSTALFTLLFDHSEILNREAFDHEVHIDFVRDMMDLIGITPDCGPAKNSYVFNLLQGELIPLQNAQDSNTILDQADTALFLRFIDRQKPYCQNGKERHALLKSVLRYFHMHIPGFREPKSLEVLRQVMND